MFTYLFISLLNLRCRCWLSLAVSGLSLCPTLCLGVFLLFFFVLACRTYGSTSLCTCICGCILYFLFSYVPVHVWEHGFMCVVEFIFLFMCCLIFNVSYLLGFVEPCSNSSEEWCLFDPPLVVAAVATYSDRVEV